MPELQSKVCGVGLQGLLQLGLLDQRQLGLLDQRQQLFWITHSCLIWKRITQCLFYNALLQMGLLFMCAIIVQPNANVYSYISRKHL